MKMSMVEPGYWDGFVKGVPGGEEDFSNLLNILDFPMESLEGDDELAGDWDASNSQSLGPIPLDALMGLPPVPRGSVRNDCLDMLPKPNVPVAGTAHKKQLPDHVKESSRVIIPHVNAISETQESRSFQTHSPVSVLESGGSCSGGKSLPIKPDIVVPGGTRSKRARASPFNPWFVMTPISYAVSTSKKTSSYKKSKEKKKELSQLSHALNSLDDSFQHAKEELFHASDATEKNETSLQHSDATKKCTHCEVTKTPQWREGPMGPKTLCNACGVRYRSGRLFPDYRPAASPTFVPTLHSRVACTASASKKTLSYKKNKEKKKKKKKLPQLSPPSKDSDDSFQHAKEELFHASDVIEKNETSMQCSDATKKCTHCEVTKTPQWREGPMGPKTLCNACGVRYRSGRLFPEYRPAASPTFVPTLHSNSHRKVIEMRKQAMHETAIVHDAPMSPTPEFVPMSSYLFNLIY